MSEKSSITSTKVRKGFDASYREVQGKKKRMKKSPGETVRRNIDYSLSQYEDLDTIAREIGITNQAAVKIAIQQFIDNFYRSKALKEEHKRQSNGD